MKKDLDTTEKVILGFIGLMVMPTIVGLSVRAVTNSYTHIANGANHIKYIRKIRKGIKDGSIELIDGKYYERIETVEEA